MKKAFTDLKRAPLGNKLWGSLALLLAIVLSAHCSLSALESLRGENSSLRKVLLPLSQKEQDERHVRLSGIISVEKGNYPALCYVAQKIKSGKTSYTLWSGTVPAQAGLLVEGQEYRLSTADALWKPLNLDDTSSTREAVWRFLRGVEPGGWFEDLCVESGAPLFVEGCLIEPRLLGDCPDSPLLLTAGPGSIQPRIDELASGALLEVSLLWLAGLLFLLLVANFWRDIPVIERIAQWNQPAPLNRFEMYLGLFLSGYVAVFLLHWLLQLNSYYFLNHYAAGAFVSGLIVLLGLLGFIELLDQLHRIKSALRLVSLSSLTPLRHLQSKGQQVALEVKVRPDAPLCRGPLTKEDYPWWRVFTEESFEVKKKTQTTSKNISSPNLISIVDESGEGLLDLCNAYVFLNAHYQLSYKNNTLHTFAPLRPFQSKVRIFTEESYLTPNETLFILGQVSKLSAADRDSSIYRDTANTPTIGGAEKLIVCAGPRGALVSLLKRELLRLELFLAITGILCASLLGVMLWFVSL
jgi:hypothetical protein